MAGALLLTLVTCVVALPREIGRAKQKVGFRGVFSMTPAVNILSAARFFLFGARDVWFVVGLPVFLHAQLGWNFAQVGGFLALWVIGYGFVQASAPALTGIAGRIPERNGRSVLDNAARHDSRPHGRGILARARYERSGDRRSRGLRLRIRGQLSRSLVPDPVVFRRRQGRANVGFYYMANAGGRLVGTVLSGWLFQSAGLPGCLWASAGMALVAGLLSLKLPRGRSIALQPA
ncbi:hypothetical protein BH20VER1_BH20VER1_23190 [soil metagenome]